MTDIGEITGQTTAEEMMITTRLSADEARALTDEVKADAAALGAKLLRLYEGGANAALGYPSWGDYCAAEFDIGRSQSYRLLDAGRVVEVIGAQSPIGDSPVNEAQARELVPLLDQPDQLRETWIYVVDEGNGRPTAAQVRERVDAQRDRSEKRGTSATRHQRGWFELLGGVGEAIGEVERRLDRLETAVTRVPKPAFKTRAQETAGRVEAIAARLRELAK